jgi:signal transduction histidine kinase
MVAPSLNWLGRLGETAQHAVNKCWRGITHVRATVGPPLIDRSGRLLDLLHRLSEADRQRTEHRLSQPAGVPSVNSYLALWVALTCVTAIVVLMPNIPVAINEPRLSIAVGSVSGVIGLALLQLHLLRFRALRRPIELHAGLAFGVLAIGNLFAAWVQIPVATGELPLERSTWFLLLTRGAAAALFLSGFATSRRQLAGSPGTRSGWIGLVCAAAFGILAIGVLLSQTGELPLLLGASSRAVLARGEPISDLLTGQQPPLVLANVVLVIALLVSAIGYTAEGRRLRDPHVAALAAGLVLIFFGQVHAFLFPILPTEYVATGDGLRVVAYGLLLLNILWRTAQDVAISATQSERLRLSRELHDGLAQQLAILRLRLGRVAELTTLSDPRTHDLEVAQRVLESASMEARRAIAALRSEHVPWEDFELALVAFAAEFSLTHEIDARVWAEPADLRLDSQLQADVLRILQETFSNAARHGQAKRIDAVVSAAGKTLRLTVYDDGLGFDPATAHQGVGLRSIAERAARRHGRLVVDAAPGKGARIQTWLPLRPPMPGQA